MARLHARATLARLHARAAHARRKATLAQILQVYESEGGFRKRKISCRRTQGCCCATARKDNTRALVQTAEANARAQTLTLKANGCMWQVSRRARLLLRTQGCV